jgi:hypothetical protein
MTDSAPSDAPQTVAAKPAPPPVHRPRSLAAEVGIIVIGVLIALVAQQAADIVRWSMDVAESRRSLKEELSRNLATMRATVRADACNLAHLDALEAWAKGKAPANPNALFRSPGLPSLGDSVWDVAKSGQVAAHMPLQERIAYARLYDGLDNQQSLVVSQRDRWSEIVAFADKPALTEEEARRLLEAISQARNITRVYHGNVEGLAELMKARGAVEPPARKPLVPPADCAPGAPGGGRPLGTPP